MHSWKSFTAKEINKRLGQTGNFWRDESFDHLVRSAKQWQCFTHYIQQNPVKAHLQVGAFRLGCGKREGEGASGVPPEIFLNPAGETPKLRSTVENDRGKSHISHLRFGPFDGRIPACQRQSPSALTRRGASPWASWREA